MPLFIGYFIGKMIGNTIVAIMKLLVQLVRIALIMVTYVLKYTFIMIEWIAVKLWQGGKGLYNHLN